MNDNNLMLGNYVADRHGDTCSVTSIGEINITVLSLKTGNKTYASVNHFTPIKISREWLRKLGFWKYYKTIYRKGNHEFYVNQNKMRVGHELLPNKSERAYLGTSKRQTLFDVEYIHQLQNLVRVLANEELTIGGGE